MDVAIILVSCSFQDNESFINKTKNIVPLEQKYVLYGVPVKTYAPKGCFTEKQVDMHAENIKEAEQVLTLPSIKQPPSTGNSRPLKRTYAVAGQ
jgi:hypothetical protein